MVHPLSSQSTLLITPSCIEQEIKNIHQHRTCHNSNQLFRLYQISPRAGRPAANDWMKYRNWDEQLRSKSSVPNEKKTQSTSINSHNNTVIINSGEIYCYCNYFHIRLH